MRSTSGPERDGAERVRGRHRRLDPVRRAGAARRAAGARPRTGSRPAPRRASPSERTNSEDGDRPRRSRRRSSARLGRVRGMPRIVVSIRIPGSSCSSTSAPPSCREATRPSRSRLAGGTKRVEVADVRLVLEGEQLGDRLERRRGSLEPMNGVRTRARRIRRARRASRRRTPAAAIRQRVDERAADAERLRARRSRASGRAVRSGRACPGAPRRTSSRRSSRADGCGAGRARRAAARRRGYGAPARSVRSAAAVSIESRRRSRALVGLLEVDPRGVDAAQDVLEPAADELALVHRQSVAGGLVASSKRPIRNGAPRVCASPRGSPAARARSAGGRSRSRAGSRPGRRRAAGRRSARRSREHAARRRGATSGGEVVVVREHLAGDAPRAVAGERQRKTTPTSSISSPRPREKRKCRMPKPARICGSCAGWPKLSGR